MKRFVLLMLFATALSAAPMTNDDVIKMAKGGLSDAIILQAIDGAEPNFDTSPDGLVKLKQGGVSDPVIQKILNRKSAAPASGAPQAAAPSAPPPACPQCGTVTSIREINKPGGASGMGAVVGGVVGGVLGRQVAGRDSRTAGTVVGAAGGAVAGHMIEKHANSGKTFEIGVRFDDGTTRTFTQDSHPSLQPGSRVRVVNGTLTTL